MYVNVNVFITGQTFLRCRHIVTTIPHWARLQLHTHLLIISTSLLSYGCWCVSCSPQAHRLFELRLRSFVWFLLATRFENRPCEVYSKEAKWKKELRWQVGSSEVPSWETPVRTSLIPENLKSKILLNVVYVRQKYRRRPTDWLLRWWWSFLTVRPVCVTEPVRQAGLSKSVQGCCTNNVFG